MHPDTTGMDIFRLPFFLINLFLLLPTFRFPFEYIFGQCFVEFYKDGSGIGILVSNTLFWVTVLGYIFLSVTALISTHDLDMTVTNGCAEYQNKIYDMSQRVLWTNGIALLSGLGFYYDYYYVKPSSTKYDQEIVSGKTIANFHKGYGDCLCGNPDAD